MNEGLEVSGHGKEMHDSPRHDMEEPVPGYEVLRIPASRENVYASYVLARSGQSVPHADLGPAAG
jgi:hypothetical protein